MVRSHLGALSAFTVAIGLAAQASAAPVTIQNWDFSDPSLTSNSVGSPADWSVIDGGVYNIEGVWSAYSNPTLPTLPTSQVAWLNGSDGAAATLSQVLSATLQPGVTYQLTYDVVSRLDAPTPAVWSAGLYVDVSGSFVALATTSNQSVVSNTWQSFTDTFTATNSSPYLGDALVVYASANGIQLDVTDFKLNAVPEPSTWAMMGLGFAAMASAAWFARTSRARAA